MQTCGRLRIAVLACVLAAGPWATAPAMIIYVDDDAAQSGDGTSWSKAYRDLQDGLADARGGAKPVVIRVAQGLYQPDQGRDFTRGDPYATFRLTAGVSMCGGFAGLGEPDPNAQGASYQTILTGDLTDNGDAAELPPRSTADPSQGNRSHRVITVDGRCDLASTRLENVIVTGAAEHPLWGDDYPSAGLYISSTGAQPLVHGCSFTANAAPGIYCFGSVPMVEHCLFDNNVASRCGGGVSIRGGSPGFRDCTFLQNWAMEGGALFMAEGRLQIEDCTFAGNTAAGLNWADTGLGGAICIEWGGTHSTITRCRFTGNIASRGGAAFFGDRGGGPMPSGRIGVVFLTECGFLDNQAGFGGALVASAFEVEARRCVFCRNTALHGGGAIVNGHSGVALWNCLFSGNQALEEAGGIRAYGLCAGVIGSRFYDCHFDLELENCTLVGNRAVNRWAITCNSQDGSQALDRLSLSNCILDDGGAEIDDPDGTPGVIHHTDLRGGPGAVSDPHSAVTWGPGNLHVNPLFGDPGAWDTNGTPDDWSDDFWLDGDYHLQSQAGRWYPVIKDWVQDKVTSPCIDAGDTNSPVADEPFPNGGRINMGVYGGTAEASKSYTSGGEKTSYTREQIP